jgi:hypothetical protein
MIFAVYRAHTQSFTTDEAFAFERYIDRDWHYFVTEFDACNHVLHTLLTKIVRQWLGTSELVLRSVSLVGAALFFIVVARLCRMAAGNGWLHTAGAAAVASNPLTLDFLIAARGYGLAVALLLWSIYYAARWFEEGGEARLLWRSGVAAGLAVAANLTVLAPVAALGFVLLLLAIRRRCVSAVIDNFAGPAVVTALVIVLLPLARASREHFYLGTKTLADAVSSLWERSMYYDPARSAIAALDVACSGCVTNSYMVVLVTVVAAIVLGAGWLLLRQRIPGLPGTIFAMTGGVLAGSLGALIFLNQTLDVRYPYGRTGLYLIPLFLLAVISGFRLAPPRWAHAAGALVMALTAGVFIGQASTKWFGEWRFDSSIKPLVAIAVRDHSAQGGNGVTVACTFWHSHTLKYYRKRMRLIWMDPNIKTDRIDAVPARYYFLSEGDHPLVQRLRLEVLAKDETSGVILARRPS